MPPRTAEFPISDRREPDLLLLLDDAFDLAIFNGGKSRRRNLALGVPRPSLKIFDACGDGVERRGAGRPAFVSWVSAGPADTSARARPPRNRTITRAR
jgi:hypothetical protein